MKSKYTLTIFFLFFICNLFAVENDTTELPPSAIKWYTELQLANPSIAKPNFVDTSLKLFHRYDFAYSDRPFIANKGLAGHAHRNLIFNPTDSKSTFSYMQYNPYKGHLFSHESIKFFRPEYVFTDLFYVMGGQAEQLFYALHSQRLTEQMVVTLKYQVNRSMGQFDKLECRNSNFYSSFDYVSKNERYQLLGTFIKNNMQNVESGGLVDHKEFEEEESDLVFLSEATGIYRETFVNIHHYYQLGFFRSDDNESDDKFINFGRINHHFSYNRQSTIFKEDNVPFDNYFEGYMPADSTQTYDSLIVHNFSNRIGYSNYRFGEQRIRFPLFFDVYLEHNHYNIASDSLGIKEKFNQFTQGVDIHTDENRLLSFKGSYDFTIYGYNNQELSVSAGGHFGHFGKFDNWFEINVSYHEKEAPYIMNNLASNYISWANNFDKSKIARAGVGYGNYLLSLKLNVFHLTNWHYFDRQAIPQQAGESFFVTSGSVKSTINFGVFGLYNHIVYQQLSNQNYEQFPELVSYHSLYADLVLFNKALYSRIGVDARYNSPYFAHSYMPIHRHFYLQDHYQTDHQYFINAFINAKISRARLFLKFKNIGSLIFDQPEYYTIPFYPIPKAEIRFGVSWMFYD